MFLVLSSAFLETAATFLSFFDVSVILREKLGQLCRLNWFLKFLTEVLVSSFYQGKSSYESKQLTFPKKEYNTKGSKVVYYCKNWFVLFILFPWQET